MTSPIMLMKPGSSAVKILSASAGDASSIPGSGRCPGEGNGSPLQHSCLGNPWTEEPGGLQSMGLPKVRPEFATKQQQQQQVMTWSLCENPRWWLAELLDWWTQQLRYREGTMLLENSLPLPFPQPLPYWSLLSSCPWVMSSYKKPVI